MYRFTFCSLCAGLQSLRLQGDFIVSFLSTCLLQLGNAVFTRLHRDFRSQPGKLDSDQWQNLLDGQGNLPAFVDNFCQEAWLAMASEKFLPQLSQAFRELDGESKVSTKDFAEACGRILPIFDYLGAAYLGPTPLRRLSCIVLLALG